MKTIYLPKSVHLRWQTKWAIGSVMNTFSLWNYDTWKDWVFGGLGSQIVLQQTNFLQWRSLRASHSTRRVRHIALGIFLCRCVARWVPQGVPLQKPSYALAWVIKHAWATSLSCVALWRTFMLLTSCATRDNMDTTICVIIPMEYIQSCHACLAWKGSDAAQGRYGWMEGGEVCGSG